MITTHEVARMLLERPDGELLIGVDIITDNYNSLGGFLSNHYIGIQPDVNPDNTLLLIAGRYTS